MKLPYGISDFRSIVLRSYYYCDRTDLIHELENSRFQLFLRPRRFGKSLLLSMLENYYDVAKKNEFDAMFGHLKIGQNPTPLRNSFFILKWDFSCVDASGTLDNIRQSLYDHINYCIKEFILYYKDYGIPEITVEQNNALISIKSLTSAIHTMTLPVYLLIDEYDNFANEVMMSSIMKTERYESLVQKEGILKTVFKNVKASSSNSIFDRVFITGVSPVVMSDLTSGYNIAENIYFEPEYNTLCGFTQDEVYKLVEQIVDERFDSLSSSDMTTESLSNRATESLSDKKIESSDKEKEINQAVELMRVYYNGYRFSLDADEKVYNPTLALYFLKQFDKSGKVPRNMFDDNLAMDEAKLIYISSISGGRQLIIDLMQEEHQALISEISRKFGIQRMLSDKTHDRAFLVSFLYYFGILTLSGQDQYGKLTLKVPNTVIKRLYVEHIHEMLIPEAMERDDGKSAAEKLFQNGEIDELCKFVEQRYFKVFHNRDYRWANELTVKTAFLTLLYNDILFIMDSEKEIDRRFADLTMIIRPDMRKFQIFDVLVEFKFVSLSTAGLTGEEAKALSVEELAIHPKISSAMDEAVKQVKDYAVILKGRYPELRLKSFAVVSLGFDRLCWKQVMCSA
ncbi:MAG: AAA family ATPase [Desulfamplus sp.]|nr:AAA family ATPase [Desulfamplus sp.]